MGRCMICESEKVEFMIKDSSDYYCRSCAEEQFADLSYLMTVEEKAQQLKDFVDKKVFEHEEHILEEDDS